MPRFANLVFQGGGVRGIAYAGVLQAMPSDLQIQAVGGTSAGALVAALLAIGKSPAELKALLEKKALYDLIDDIDSARMDSIREFWDRCRDCWDGKKGKVSLFKLWQLWRNHNQITKIAREVWEERGVHRSEKLRHWLDDVLEGKRFQDITVEDLRIVAANVSEQRYSVYSKLENLNTSIAEAVHASVSIPLFFAPLRLGPQHLVDGGLLSNFPSFLFSQGQYPTIGFRLGELTPPKQIDSTFDCVKALVLTMAEAHDKERALPPHFKQFWIKTPSDISSTKFRLNDEDIKRIFDSGFKIGKKVDWNRYSSTKPIVTYYDPKADLTLQYSLKQTSKLADIYSHEELWVDEAHFGLTLRAKIERDWTVVYSRDTDMRISGETPLICQRFTAFANVSYASLVDLQFTADEIDGGLRKQLIRIPMFNKENEKGFLLFFNSPVRPGTTRRFQTSVAFPREFSRTLAIGHEDEVSFLLRQIAKIHTAAIDFEILLDVELPEITLQSRFGHALAFQGSIVASDSGREYHRYTAHIPHATVQAVMDFTVRLQP